MNDNLMQYFESNNRILKYCKCEFGKRMSTKKAKLTNICSATNQCHKNDFFGDYKIQPPITNKTQYLYVDQSFISNVNCPPNDEVFYDCCMSESETASDANLTANIKEPRNLKILLKDVAMTTHILYKTFRKAYHTTKKGKSHQKDKMDICEPNIKKRKSVFSPYNRKESLHHSKSKSQDELQMATIGQYPIKRKNRNLEVTENELINRLQAGRSDHAHIEQGYIEDDHNKQNQIAQADALIDPDENSLYDKVCSCEKKRQKKTKSIRMEPVSVTIPVTLFVESAKGQRTFHTKMIMEAFGDLDANMKAIDSKNVEPIRTASISADTNANNSGSQIDNELPQNERGGEAYSRLRQDADVQTDQYICNESVQVQTMPSIYSSLHILPAVNAEKSNSSTSNDEEKSIEEEDMEMELERCACQNIPTKTNLKSKVSKSSLRDNSSTPSRPSFQKRQPQSFVPIKYKSTALTELTVKTSIMSLGSEIFFSCGSSEENVGKTKRQKQGKLKFNEKRLSQNISNVPKEEDELSGVDDMPLAVHVFDQLNSPNSLETSNFKFITESRSDLMSTELGKPIIQTTQRDSEELICGKNLECASRTDNKDEHMPFPDHNRQYKLTSEQHRDAVNDYLDVRGSKAGQTSNAPEHFRVSKMRTTYKLYNSQECSTYYRKLTINDEPPIETNLKRYSSLPINYITAPFQRKLIKSNHLTNISTNPGKIKYIKLIPFEPQAPPIFYGELESLDALAPSTRKMPVRPITITYEPEILMKQTSFPDNFNLKTHVLDYNPYMKDNKVLKLSDLQNTDDFIIEEEETLESTKNKNLLDDDSSDEDSQSSDSSSEEKEGEKDELKERVQLNKLDAKEILPRDILPNVNSVSIQTDGPAMSTGHKKRVYLRCCILDKLYELIQTDKRDSVINFYNLADREQILQDMHKITSGNLSLIQSTRSGRDIMTIEKIKYLFSELSDDIKINYNNIPVYEDTLTEYDLSEQKIIIDNLRHILNPKTRIKPKHVYSKATQEQILQYLTDLLKSPSTSPLKGYERQMRIKHLRQKLISDGKILNSGQPIVKDQMGAQNLMNFRANERNELQRDSIMEGRKSAGPPPNLWTLYTRLTEDRTTSTSSISLYRYVNENGNISEEIKQLKNAKYVQTDRLPEQSKDDLFLYEQSIKKSKQDLKQFYRGALTLEEMAARKRRYDILRQRLYQQEAEDSNYLTNYVARSSILLQKIDYRDSLRKSTELQQQTNAAETQKPEKRAIIVDGNQMKKSSYIRNNIGPLTSILSNYDPPGDFENLRKRWRPTEDYRPFNKNYNEDKEYIVGKEQLGNMVEKQLKVLRKGKTNSSHTHRKKQYLFNDSSQSTDFRMYSQNRISLQNKLDEYLSSEESSSTLSSSDYDEKMINEQTMSEIRPTKSNIQVQFEEDNGEYVSRSSIFLNTSRKSKLGKNSVPKNYDKSKAPRTTQEFISRSKITLTDKSKRNSGNTSSNYNMSQQSNTKLFKIKELIRSISQISPDEKANKKADKTDKHKTDRHSIKTSSSTNIENNPNHLNSSMQNSALKTDSNELNSGNIVEHNKAKNEHHDKDGEHNDKH